jgi:hypothetical protein
MNHLHEDLKHRKVLFHLKQTRVSSIAQSFYAFHFFSKEIPMENKKLEERGEEGGGKYLLHNTRSTKFTKWS